MPVNYSRHTYDRRNPEFDLIVQGNSFSGSFSHISPVYEVKVDDASQLLIGLGSFHYKDDENKGS